MRMASGRKPQAATTSMAASRSEVTRSSPTIRVKSASASSGLITSRSTRWALGQVDHAGPAGDQGGAARGAGQQRADLGGVAGVVQQDQDAAAVEGGAVERGPFLEAVGDGGVGDAEGAQEGAEHGLRFGDGGAGALQVDVELAVGELLACGVRDMHGQGGLADAADAGHR